MSESASQAIFQNASMSPMLSVREGAKALDFYQAAFSAKVLFRMDDPGSGIVAQLAIGKAAFWISDESPDHLNFSPQSIGGTTVRMVIVLDDPHAAFENAIAAGAEVLCPVTDEDYGWRIGRLLDPFGHIWEIGKPLGN